MSEIKTIVATFIILDKTLQAEMTLCFCEDSRSRENDPKVLDFGFCSRSNQLLSMLMIRLIECMFVTVQVPHGGDDTIR